MSMKKVVAKAQGLQERTKVLDGPIGGLLQALDPLIERCISRTAKNKAIMGLMKEGATNKYLHPLPSLQSQKLSWVNRMVEHCRG